MTAAEPGAPRRVPTERGGLDPRPVAGAAARGRLFAWVGCGLRPGFEHEDFELATRQALLAEFPAQRELVLRLTRTPEESAWP